MTYIYVFLAGLIVGAVGVFILSHKSSAKVKKAKAEAETEYQTKLASIEKDRAAKVAELEEKKASLEALKKQLDSLTAEQAQGKLSSESQSSIQNVTDQAVTDIMAKVKAASKS